MSVTLALDFDGVVCDAFDECALVTWLGVRAHDRSVSAADQLRLLPADFVARFRVVRDYSRVLGHFVVAHHPDAEQVRSQSDFDALAESMPAPDVARFVASATAVRDRFRTTETAFWLGLHTLYPGVPELLRRHAGEVVIVTAKDADSVGAILDWHGLAHTVAEIHGDCADKAATIREVAARHGVTTDAVTFVDDNLTNARRVSATGARSLWARWGYQTPEHRAEAELLAVASIDLADLGGLTGGAVGARSGPVPSG